jgi:ATP:corrinoid adenosyltransferase
MRVGGVQFFKHEQSSYGELKALEKMGITLTPMGERWDCVVRSSYCAFRSAYDR